MIRASTAERLWSAVPRLMGEIQYCVLATADESGTPWATPVYFAERDHRELLWVSGLESRHSRNIAARPDIAVTIFDSTAPVGHAEALYLIARAQVCDNGPAALRSLNIRLPSHEKLAISDISPAGPLTVYSARIRQFFVLVRGGDPTLDNVLDERYAVHPPPAPRRARSINRTRKEHL